VIQILKTFEREKMGELLADKGLWVTVGGIVLAAANKFLKLGLDDATMHNIALALGAYVVGHFVNKAAETHATISSGPDGGAK
jgi:hypothetical protein